MNGAVRVQLESVSGHSATNIHDVLLQPNGCRDDVFTAVMQVQLRVIGKRVKSDTVSVGNARAYSGAGSSGSETRHPLICRVYNGSLVYSFVALNRIKYHQNSPFSDEK